MPELTGILTCYTRYLPNHLLVLSGTAACWFGLVDLCWRVGHRSSYAFFLLGCMTVLCGSVEWRAVLRRRHGDDGSLLAEFLRR